MAGLFSVNTIAFTVLGYSMRWIELVGTVTYLWSVWLIAKRKMLTWPVGIVSVILYMLLFYQIRLYSDAFEQAYYLVASAYGWIHWARRGKEDESTSGVRLSQPGWLAFEIVFVAIVGCGFGLFMAHAHTIAPVLFPEAAAFPYLDALTTVASFVAMWLLARKRLESWVIWIAVDIVGIGLYFAKDVKLLSLLYVILLGMAIKGLVEWIRAAKGLKGKRPSRKPSRGPPTVEQGAHPHQPAYFVSLMYPPHSQGRPLRPPVSHTSNQRRPPNAVSRKRHPTCRRCSYRPNRQIRRALHPASTAGHVRRRR